MGTGACVAPVSCHNPTGTFMLCTSWTSYYGGLSSTMGSSVHLGTYAMSSRSAHRTLACTVWFTLLCSRFCGAPALVSSGDSAGYSCHYFSVRIRLWGEHVEHQQCWEVREFFSGSVCWHRADYGPRDDRSCHGSCYWYHQCSGSNRKLDHGGDHGNFNSYRRCSFWRS